MNGVVIDTSVVLGWALPDEPWHQPSLGLMRDIASGALEALVAPHLWFELANGLMKAARRGRMPWDGVPGRLAAVRDLALPVHCETIEEDDLLAACRSFGIGWGDAHHVLVAAGQGLPLITADLRLIAALERAPLWVEAIFDRPVD